MLKDYLNCISPKLQRDHQEKMLIFYGQCLLAKDRKSLSPWAEVKRVQLSKIFTTGNCSHCRISYSAVLFAHSQV